MSRRLRTIIGNMSLSTFSLDELAQYTPEGAFPEGDSPDFRAFYVGRDDVHSILKHLLDNVTLSVQMNMFGFDDDALNLLLMEHVKNPNIVVSVTLDKSQAGGVHEKKLIEADEAADPAGFAN